MTRILIASDVRLYREGLATALADLGRLSIVGGIAGSDLTLACLSHFGPDVVLLDMTLSGCLGLPVALHTEPPVKFVVFAVSEGDDGVLACAEAGFAGYVGKDDSAEDLVLTIEGALRGEVLCPPQIAGALFRRLAVLVNSHGPDSSISALTHRQLEIIELLDQGHSNKEIAQRLRIGPATVKNHVHNILESLHVRRRAEAAAAVRVQSCTGGILPLREAADEFPALQHKGCSQPCRLWLPFRPFPNAAGGVSNGPPPGQQVTSTSQRHLARSYRSTRPRSPRPPR